jgi:hypothetical protein
MKKLAVILVILFMTQGCGWISRKLAWWTDYSEICVKGVLYYQFTSGASVAYNVDGSVKRCNN